jgi:hypothetical protein
MPQCRTPDHDQHPGARLTRIKPGNTNHKKSVWRVEWHGWPPLHVTHRRIETPTRTLHAVTIQLVGIGCAFAETPNGPTPAVTARRVAEHLATVSPDTPGWDPLPWAAAALHGAGCTSTHLAVYAAHDLGTTPDVTAFFLGADTMQVA